MAATEKSRFLSAGGRNCFFCAAIGLLHRGKRSSILFGVFDRTEQLLDVMRWKARLEVGDRSKGAQTRPAESLQREFLVGLLPSKG